MALPMLKPKAIAAMTSVSNAMMFAVLIGRTPFQELGPAVLVMLS